MGAMHVEVHGGEAGQGSPPLLLIHGAGGTRLQWPPQIRRLRGACVLAVDLPGHGESPGPGAGSIEAYAKAILHWLDTNGVAGVIPVGHSMGGAIALTLALQVPERVAGIALVGSGARLRVAPAILEASAQPATFPQAVDTIIDWAFSDSAPARLVDLARKRMLAVNPAVLHGDFAACNKFDVMPRLASIRQPALILCGTQDRLTPFKFSQYLADHLPASRLLAIESAGHMAMLERPAAVAGALVNFISEISPTS